MQKIIDSHFHIWRQKNQPSLTGPIVPRIFGPYEAIRRDYPIEEFLADQQGSGVTKGVYVQTNWAKENFEAEVAFLTETADRTGWPHAIVGYADMTVDDVRPQIDRPKKYPLLRCVRMQLHWHETSGLPLRARCETGHRFKCARQCAAPERLRPRLRSPAVPGTDGGWAAARR